MTYQQPPQIMWVI